MCTPGTAAPKPPLAREEQALGLGPRARARGGRPRLREVRP